MKQTLLFLSTMTLAVLLAAGVALAEIRGGTNNGETIVGTNAADQITGQGGNDTLKGLAANDTYHFDDGFGTDTVTETASVKVGKKKRPGGVDTLSFSHHDGFIYALLIPRWGASYNRVSGPSGFVNLGSSPIENVTGGTTNDGLYGGPANNTLSGGTGGADQLVDYGGNDGSAISDTGLPDLRASNDTYRGFTAGFGRDLVVDYGGTADKLDLRPLESSEVYFDPFDYNLDGTIDSLRIEVNDAITVTVMGHFSPPVPGRENGRMEQIVFSNETVTSAAELNSLIEE